MKTSEIFYTVGIFFFGGLIAFGLVQGISMSRTIVAGTVDVAPRVQREVVKEAAPTPVEDTQLLARVDSPALHATQKETDPRSLPGKNVVADLKEMTLSLYEDGVSVAELPILAKGRSGTPWETIPGLYSVKTKEQNHFSSIGHVWMPYSMQFFGNYFIHGWPYYEGGAPVAQGFSGGCIRLSTADAKKVYEFATLGTAVHVLGDQEIAPIMNASYKIKNKNAFPKISAQSYLIGDLDTGEIIFSKNASDVYPTASLAKLMTATVSLEAVNQYQRATVSKNALTTYGEQGGLKAGETFEVKDLIYPLLLESSNDAAEVLAEQIGRSQFLSLMNEKADAIGLLSTHFDDPAGLSQETVSTSKDLFKLVRYINNYKSYILAVTRLPQYETGKHSWHNISRFVSDKNYIGGKDGYTDEAKHTKISLFKMKLSEFSDRNIAFVFLDDDTRTKEQDVRTMVDFVGKNVYYAPEMLSKK